MKTVFSFLFSVFIRKILYFFTKKYKKSKWKLWYVCEVSKQRQAIRINKRKEKEREKLIHDSSGKDTNTEKTRQILSKDKF